jgi:hypothetical protein
MQDVRRDLAAVYAFAVFFAAFAATAIVIGVHDASLDEATFGVTATSVILIGIGTTLSVAVYHLVLLTRRSWPEGVRPPCTLVVLLAFFVTLLLGIYLLFAALGSASGQWPGVLVVALLLMVVSALGLRFFAGPAHVTLPRVGAAVALGVIGTGVGAWEFWYQNQYVPSHAGHAVELTVKLRRDGRDGAYDVIHGTLSYEDVGGKSVWVLGSVYTLTGSRVVSCRQPATVQKVFHYFNYLLVDPQRLRYSADVAETEVSVLAAGRFVGDGKRLDPSVPAGRDLVFLVPTKQDYQLLRLRAQLYAIPGSVELSQRTAPQYTLYKDHEVYGIWHIDDDSWLHDLVYGRERWVVLRYELVDPSKPGAVAATSSMRVTARFPAATWSQKPPSLPSIARLFAHNVPSDASEPFADSELALAPVTTSC